MKKALPYIAAGVATIGVAKIVYNAIVSGHPAFAVVSLIVASGVLIFLLFKMLKQA